jgi:threonine dehydrogenase-like Zn-dependent dehydrogenase
LARKESAVSLFASLPKGAFEITFDSRTVHYEALRVVGASNSRPACARAAVGLIGAGKIGQARPITHRISLTELPAGLEVMKQMQSLEMMVCS